MTEENKQKLFELFVCLVQMNLNRIPFAGFKHYHIGQVRESSSIMTDNKHHRVKMWPLLGPLQHKDINAKKYLTRLLMTK